MILIILAASPYLLLYPVLWMIVKSKNRTFKINKTLTIIFLAQAGLFSTMIAEVLGDIIEIK